VNKNTIQKINKEKKNTTE